MFLIGYFLSVRDDTKYSVNPDKAVNKPKIGNILRDSY